MRILLTFHMNGIHHEPTANKKRTSAEEVGTDQRDILVVWYLCGDNNFIENISATVKYIYDTLALKFKM